MISSKPRSLPLNTLQDVVDSGLPIKAISKARAALDLNNTILKPLISRVEEDDDGIDELIEYGNLTVIDNKPVLTIYTPPIAVSARSNNVTDLHFVKEVVSIFHATYMVSFYERKYLLKILQLLQFICCETCPTWLQPQMDARVLPP